MNNERSHHVEVGGSVDPDDADINLTCHVCDWHVWVPVTDDRAVMLADLIDLADEHFDATGGHP